MNSRPIRFFHRNALVEVASASTTRTVLDWLREDARCVGTKEGCNEGDCGACTVAIGERSVDADDRNAVGGLSLTTANACLVYLPALDGKALFTIEDVTPGKGPLHPVQRALVDCHGSQCGFCTPGFVMSLWVAYQRHAARGTRPTRQELADELSGNLCRCTGYRPILDAGERMLVDAPAVPIHTLAAVAALESMRSDRTFFYQAGGACFVAPRTLEAFAAEREARPDATILAGATDIGLWTNKQFRDLPELLFIGGVDALKRIEVQDSTLSIGAAISLEGAWRAIVERWPTLAEIWLRFAGTPLRHAGTMAGNVANGSPIGDAAPVLMALDARLVLRRGGRQRRVSLADFYTGYMTNLLERGEFLEAIEVPLTAGDTTEVRAWKISKRFDCDISAVCAGFAIDVDRTTGLVRRARFAFGGMGATVRRAVQAEATVIGRHWSETALAAAQAALGRDFQPVTDLRASSAYRLQVARNLLRRLWLETRLEAPLPPAETGVWNRIEEGTA
jgi:xanthine dehydrogenase small subunit